MTTPPLHDPRDEYERRVRHWTEVIERGERTHVTLSNLRLTTAGLAAFVAWLVFFRRSGVSIAWFVVPAVAFLVLIVVHALVLQRNERSERARAFSRRGLARLDGLWASAGSDGARLTGEHAYARDLDIFGPGSLFQFLTTARTETGEDTLADWLRAPASLDEIRARQVAVDELKGKLDFREGLWVVAAEAHVGRTAGLSLWASTPPAGLAQALGWAFGVVGVAAGLTLGFGLAGWVGTAPVFAMVLGELILALLWRRKVHQVLHAIETPAIDLRLVRQLVERIEHEPFESPRLSALSRTFVEGGVSASSRLRRLESLTSILDATHNPLVGPLMTALLVPQQIAVAIDGWHRRHGPSLAAWLRAVGDLEALSSLAAFAYERPHYPFPTIVEAGDAGPVFDAREMAHPLIPEPVAVRNDVRLSREGALPQVLIVSGSNMSGKSTLLRAVGVNVVLALAGGPVAATGMRVSVLAIGATLRVEDSLRAGLSRFYAEILRIRAIVATASGPQPLIFLLDEILHGTNSHDRRIGAEAIVRTLVRLGAIGLVTTHDLALTELAASMGPSAANVHFEDRIVDNRMVFDYRMRPGVVEHSNALALMRAIGLEV